MFLCSIKYFTIYCFPKQAGTGPSLAPYPRLKNSEKTSKCQVFSFTVLENQKNFRKKKFSKKLHTQKNGPSGALKSHNAEKLKGGPFGIFQHPICRKTSKN